MQTSETSSSELCQIETAQNGGRLRRPGFLYVPSRILWNFKHRGFRYTFHATMAAQVSRIRERLGLEKRKVLTPHCEDAVLGLEPGELVQVKSFDEIAKTLDAKGRHRGLVFTPEMKQHCGKQFRVYKRLELMFDEYHKSQRRLQNTVLLENNFCTGAGLGCDRSCFLYWREVWLRRLEAPRNQ